MAQAAAYREVREALQHTRTGRDQKVVGKLKSGKGSSKGKFGKKSFTTPCHATLQAKPPVKWTNACMTTGLLMFELQRTVVKIQAGVDVSE